MARRNFPNLPYGPYELRPVLRGALKPGERAIAWGTIQEASGLTDFLTFTLRWCLVALPGVWGLVGLVVPAALQVRTWGAVLTDRRLLLLQPETARFAGGSRGVVAEYGLDSLGVDTVATLASRPAFGPGAGLVDVPAEEEPPSSAEVFRLSPASEPAFWVRVPGGDGEEGGAARLREGLTVLAGVPRAARVSGAASGLVAER